MRIGGISSGIDTEQIVKDLMKAERIRVNKFFQQEQKLKWRQEAFNNVNKTLANFILNTRKDFGLNQISYTGTIQKSSVNNLTWTKKATSSNESVATTIAKANALNGNHTLEVEKLATNASVISTGDVEAKLNLAEGLYRINIETKVTNKESSPIETNKTTINLFLNDDSTVNDVVKALNNAKDSSGKSLGINAAYDSKMKRLMITNQNTGEENYINFEAVAGGQSNELLSALKLNFGTVKGADAEFNFNGNPMKNSSNNFSIFGIDIQLKATNKNNLLTINVGTDVGGIVDKIKSFVNQYNDLIESINKELHQEVYRSFTPLTSEQKEVMSDRDIELWEGKAKSGLLKSDGNLSKMLQTVRAGLYETVDLGFGNKIRLVDVGITTGAYQEQGKLVIDEQKLSNAISANPDKVIGLFFNVGEVDWPGSTGLVQRLQDGLVSGMKEIIFQAGPGEDSTLFRNVQGNMLIDFVIKGSSMINKDLSSLNTRIAKEEQLLFSKENRYWQRFTAMEKAMSKMNQQSSWLMSQLGMGQQ